MGEVVHLSDRQRVDNSSVVSKSRLVSVAARARADAELLKSRGVLEETVLGWLRAGGDRDGLPRLLVEGGAEVHNGLTRLLEPGSEHLISKWVDPSFLEAAEWSSHEGVVRGEWLGVLYHTEEGEGLVERVVVELRGQAVGGDDPGGNCPEPMLCPPGWESEPSFLKGLEEGVKAAWGWLSDCDVTRERIQTTRWDTLRVWVGGWPLPVRRDHLPHDLERLGSDREDEDESPPTSVGGGSLALAVGLATVHALVPGWLRKTARPCVVSAACNEGRLVSIQHIEEKLAAAGTYRLPILCADTQETPESGEVLRLPSFKEAADWAFPLSGIKPLRIEEDQLPDNVRVEELPVYKILDDQDVPPKEYQLFDIPKEEFIAELTAPSGAGKTTSLHLLYDRCFRDGDLIPFYVNLPDLFKTDLPTDIAGLAGAASGVEDVGQQEWRGWLEDHPGALFLLDTANLLAGPLLQDLYGQSGLLRKLRDHADRTRTRVIVARRWQPHSRDPFTQRQLRLPRFQLRPWRNEIAADYLRRRGVDKPDDAIEILKAAGLELHPLILRLAVDVWPFSLHDGGRTWLYKEWLDRMLDPSHEPFLARWEPTHEHRETFAEWAGLWKASRRVLEELALDTIIQGGVMTTSTMTRIVDRLKANTEEGEAGWLKVISPTIFVDAWLKECPLLVWSGQQDSAQFLFATVAEYLAAVLLPNRPERLTEWDSNGEEWDRVVAWATAMQPLYEFRSDSGSVRTTLGSYVLERIRDWKHDRPRAGFVAALVLSDAHTDAEIRKDFEDTLLQFLYHNSPWDKASKQMSEREWWEFILSAVVPAVAATNREAASTLVGVSTAIRRLNKESGGRRYAKSLSEVDPDVYGQLTEKWPQDRVTRCLMTTLAYILMWGERKETPASIINQLINDQDEWIRSFAARSAGRLLGEDAKETLKTLASNADSEQVALASFTALKDLTPTHADLKWLVARLGVRHRRLRRWYRLRSRLPWRLWETRTALLRSAGLVLSDWAKQLSDGAGEYNEIDVEAAALLERASLGLLRTESDEETLKFVASALGNLSVLSRSSVNFLYEGLVSSVGENLYQVQQQYAWAIGNAIARAHPLATRLVTGQILSGNREEGSLGWQILAQSASVASKRKERRGALEAQQHDEQLITEETVEAWVEMALIEEDPTVLPNAVRALGELSGLTPQNTEVWSRCFERLATLAVNPPEQSEDDLLTAIGDTLGWISTNTAGRAVDPDLVEQLTAQTFHSRIRAGAHLALRQLAKATRSLPYMTWDQFISTYKEDMQIKGRVQNFARFGVFVDLAEDDMMPAGLIHISEFEGPPSNTLSIGQVIWPWIKRIRNEDQRRDVALSLQESQSPSPEEPATSDEPESDVAGLHPPGPTPEGES